MNTLLPEITAPSNSSNVIPFPSQVRRAHPAQVQEKPDFNGLTAELIVKQFREGTMPEALLRYLLALVWPVPR
jgi:hypothetical protein